MDFTEETALDAVLASFSSTPDARVREVLMAVTTHLHALMREVRPSMAEWEQAIAFLTAVGQKCDDTRQEFVLLSDVLGISMLVETINGDEHATEGTVLGPFHMTESPARELGDSIDLLGQGTPCLVSGTVTDIAGVPIAGASVDVWQCTAEGFYDVQQPDVQPPGNGRGVFRTDEAGGYRFRSVVPSHYPIPTDGPVGTLLDATRRHPFRPAHVHLQVTAPGYAPVTTHLFVADSPYVDSDAVFAVKRSLVREFEECDDLDEARAAGLPVPFRRARFDVRLVEEA
ncbi:hydroxyquinol 1,2-dioxygenase [Nocardioides maradonensis]